MLLALGRRGPLAQRPEPYVVVGCGSRGNDPSAGSPTER